MAQIFRQTSFYELWGQGYPQESVSQQLTEATRTYLIPWEDRFQARMDFLGYSQTYQISTMLLNGDQGYADSISRVTPDFHPGYLRPDGTPYLYADNVTFEPFGAPTDENGQPIYGSESTIDDFGEPVYTFAKMTVHYSSRLYNILDDNEMAQAPYNAAVDGIIDESTLFRYVEIPFAVGAQYLSLPDGTFQYAHDSLTNVSTDIFGNSTNAPAGPVSGSPGKVEGQWDVTMIWRQVPIRMIASAAVIRPFAPRLGIGNIQESAWDLAIGRVNSDTFAGYPPGTLLCEPPELTQWVQSTGEIVFDVSFHFKYFRQGWNYLLVKNLDTPSRLVYTEVSVNGTPQPPDETPPQDGAHQYDSFPFQTLFLGYVYSAGYIPNHI